MKKEAFPSQSPMQEPPVALTIAGSDPSGGAGIQADLKAFAALNVYGTSVITALTAQNTQHVQSSHVVPAEMIKNQCITLHEDIRIAAIKIGMLANVETVMAVAEMLTLFKGTPIVLDPVMVATSGDLLLAEDAIDALVQHIIPKVMLITPNLHEASLLLGKPAKDTEQDCREYALELYKQLQCPLILKGSHGVDHTFIDFFVSELALVELSVPYHHTRNTHGTGCTYSAAIAAGLAHQLPLKEAVLLAKTYINLAITGAVDWQIGKGHGPVCHNVFSSGLPSFPNLTSSSPC